MDEAVVEGGKNAIIIILLHLFFTLNPISYYLK